ncbi:MAG: tRNA 2-thiouridine(34) synthase MnmA [Oscillospiraceae bacterium]|nr:tRNA 2-thiouridine(34) synthase MnmA [Oscillospiraceae bacterium]
MKKALIAMSGGVDSSVAAYLTKEGGFDCVGVMMKLFDDDSDNYDTPRREKACCTLEDADDARSVAAALGIPFYVFNFSDEFSKQVIERFVDAYQNGATPNPCIDCNRYMKFERLFLRANEMDMDYIVTGHYAKIEYDVKTKRTLLKKAVDATKDQSYVLYSMTQEQLSRTLLPLGGLCKNEIRDIAAKKGFINAYKRDSQDICFVRDGDYARFIEEYTGTTFLKGDFIDTNGKIIGKHNGIIRYTVGQRKRLGISFAEPMYVRSKDLSNNTVTLCTNEGLYSRSLTASDFNWISFDKPPETSIRVKAKIRYNQIEQSATAEVINDNGEVRVEFDEPQRAIAKGQAVVLYNDDIVVGGGVIL